MSECGEAQRTRRRSASLERWARRRNSMDLKSVEGWGKGGGEGRRGGGKCVECSCTIW